MSAKIQLRRDTGPNWTATNPVLAEGELGIDLSTNQIKIGDGSTRWQNLEYATMTEISPSQVTGTAVITTDSRLSDQRTPLDGSVTSAKIVDGTIATADLADGSVTMAKTASTSLVPTGCLSMWATATAPTGWLIADGSAVSRTTYAALYAVIGTTYGSGNGSTTFNLPNFQGRVPVGVGTAVANGATAHTLAQKDGEETHTLTTAEMPSHSHQFRAAGLGALNTTPANWDDIVGASTNSAGVGPATAEDSAANAIQPRGGGGAHNNMQPYLSINYIIKT